MTPIKKKTKPPLMEKKMLLLKTVCLVIIIFTCCAQTHTDKHTQTYIYMCVCVAGVLYESLQRQTVLLN